MTKAPDTVKVFWSDEPVGNQFVFGIEFSLIARAGLTDTKDSAKLNLMGIFFVLNFFKPSLVCKMA